MGTLLVVLAVLVPAASFYFGRRTAPKPAPAVQTPRLFALKDARALYHTLVNNAAAVKQTLAYLGFNVTVAQDASATVAGFRGQIEHNKMTVEGAKSQIEGLKAVITGAEAGNTTLASEIADTEALAKLLSE